MFQFPLSVPRLILLSGAYLLKKLENNWGNLFQKVKKLLFLLANLICQLKILTYHSIMLTQIINAKILTPQGWLKDGSVLMRDNKILEVTNCDLAVIGAELIDAKGMYVVPGGVEIHCHGGGGGDFMEGTEEAFRTAINAHMKHGTTSIFPTLSSSTVPMIEAAAETCTRLMAEPDSPVLGLHLEGHYLNMKMAGGQMPENIKDPDPKEYIPIVEKWGCIKRWDAAPELPGAMQFGKYITGKGILASVKSPIWKSFSTPATFICAALSTSTVRPTASFPQCIMSANVSFTIISSFVRAIRPALNAMPIIAG